MSKVSEKQRLEKRNRIIRSAVETISKKGLKGAAMSEIARKAGVGYAAVYSYFPAREAIVCAWYKEQLDLSVERLKTVAGFDEFSLQEQLQAFFETQLEGFLPDREFVNATLWTVTFSLPRDDPHLQAIRSGFDGIIADLLEAAVQVDEIPDQVFLGQIYSFFWLYNAGIVFYWLKDGSDQFQNTTVLLDKSLDLAVSFLRAGILNKVLDILTFLLKTHIIGYQDILRDPMEIVHRVKRQFMGGKHA